MSSTSKSSSFVDGLIATFSAAPTTFLSVKFTLILPISFRCFFAGLESCAREIVGLLFEVRSNATPSRNA
eukprot:scaffold22648_cov86-Skeletonema_menzelii.AAC.1